MDTPTSSSLDRPSSFPWPPILVVGAFLVAWLLGIYLPLPWPGVDDWAARIIGVGIGVLGIALFAWSAWTLYVHRTTILPTSPASALVTSGPFSIRRNPIYLADTMLILGAAELTKNIWFVIAAALFVPLITWLAILPEERYLEAKFGDAYRAYKARTRRLI